LPAGWIAELDAFFDDDEVSLEEKTAFFSLILAIQVENRPEWMTFIERTKQKVGPEKSVSEESAEAGATTEQQ
ncbi:MAG: hypothetical protein ACYTET_00005, partial [Planctomycetota bacterium]